jgi:hypothetical protein
MVIVIVFSLFLIVAVNKTENLGNFALKKLINETTELAIELLFMMRVFKGKKGKMEQSLKITKNKSKQWWF